MEQQSESGPAQEVQSVAITENVAAPEDALKPVEVESIPEMGAATAVNEHAAITVTAPDANPSALKRAVALAHEIVRRVVLEGEHILDKIEAVLHPSPSSTVPKDSADPGAGE